MAYVSKEKKQKIAAALKTVMPKGWRWSLAINHGSIASAPVDLMAEAMRVRKSASPPGRSEECHERRRAAFR